MKPKIPKVIVLVAIGIVAMFFILPSYAYATLTTDSHQELIEKEHDDDFPYDLGVRFDISYKAVYDAVYRPDSYIVLTVVKTDYNVFADPEFRIIYDDKPSYWEFVLHWWGFSTAEVVGDPLFSVQTKLRFIADAGWEEYVVLEDNTKFVRDLYDDAGTYEKSFQVDRRSYSGTYTLSSNMQILVGDVWSATIAWDKEVITQVNPFE